MVWLASCHMKAWRTKGKHKQHRTHAQSRNLDVPAQTCVKKDCRCMMPCHIVSLQSVRCHYITSGRRTETRLLSKMKSEQRPHMAASLSPSLRAHSSMAEDADDKLSGVQRTNSRKRARASLDMLSGPARFLKHVGPQIIAYLPVAVSSTDLTGDAQPVTRMSTFFRCHSRPWRVDSSYHIYVEWSLQ